MSISSRTPEGPLHHCPVCGQVAAIESSPQGDACCPSCGQLLWWLQDRLKLEALRLDMQWAADLGFDSIETVELVMELEEAFEIDIPEEEAERLKTIADVIRYIRQKRKEEEQ